MKEVFIGSSSEAIGQVQQIAGLLSHLNGITPLLWNQAFGIGDITFLAIEEIADRVLGASVDTQNRPVMDT